MSKVQIAIIQETPVFLNLEASVEKAISCIQKAAGEGAELIAFAECWLPGYPVWLDFAPEAAVWDHSGAKALFELLAQNSVTQGDKHLAAIQKASDQTGTNIIMGTHEREGATLYNTSFMFKPGCERPIPHRKLVPTYTERLVWGRGDGSTLQTIDTKWGPIGNLICWEHWMPLARAAMHAQKEAIHIAQWPVVKEMHQIASRHYAFEGRCAVVAAGSIMSKRDILDGFHSTGSNSAEAEALLASMPGELDDLIHTGGSSIIAADGCYITAPVFDASTIVNGTVDLSIQQQEAMTLDTDGHYSRPDIFELSVNTRKQKNVIFGSDEP